MLNWYTKLGTINTFAGLCLTFVFARAWAKLPYISILCARAHTRFLLSPFLFSYFLMQEHDLNSMIPAMIQHYEKARECIDINYYGTKRMCAAFIPLLRLSNSPKIVNLTSYYGLIQVRKTIQERLKKCTFLNF